MKYFCCLDIGCNWGLDPFKTPTHRREGIPSSAQIDLEFQEKVVLRSDRLWAAREMIREAGTLGVDAVKFQYYSTADIQAYEDTHPPSKYTQKTYNLIETTELSMEDLKELAAKCKRNNVEFMATPFINPEKVKDLDPLVRRWKIRERDSGNEKLLAAALATGKAVYVSRTTYDINLCAETMGQLQQVYCIPKYPASWADFGYNLEYLHVFNGYSNHIPETAAPLLVCAHALKSPEREFYLELHYKLKGTTPIDDAVSFHFEQVKGLVEVLREWESASRSSWLAERDRMLENYLRF